jgi:hypothetical protein
VTSIRQDPPRENSAVILQFPISVPYPSFLSDPLRVARLTRILNEWRAGDSLPQCDAQWNRALAEERAARGLPCDLPRRSHLRLVRGAR